MTPVVKNIPASAPDELVPAALRDPDVQQGLLDHARAVLKRWLADRPAIIRSESVEEAVQNTHLRALQKRQAYDSNAGSVSGWLHGLMNNVLRETIRSLCKMPAQEPEDKAAWERLAIDLTPSAVESVSERLAAADYLARLTPEQRELLRLRFEEDLSHEEISTRLGISPGNARVRLSRALTALKVIAGVGPEEDRP